MHQRIEKVKGQLVEIVKVSSHGPSRIAVEVRQVKRIVKKNEKGETIDVRYKAFGETFESFGGFKYAKDFDKVIAEKMALENAVAKIR